MTKRLLALSALLLASYGCSQAQETAATAPVAAEAPAPTLLTNLQDERIKEGSGIAASRRYPGLFYVHNDSGDTARVFLINKKGETVALLTVKGAYARDWEDIAFSGEYVYVGDIGDNLENRDAVQVYRFKEPTVDPEKLGQETEVTPETVALQYPGGPRNAETLLASPDGRVWIVSKSTDGSYVFSARFKAKKTETMKRLGDKIQFGATGIFTKLATGGDFSSDGTKLTIVTYAQLYEWKLDKAFEIADLAKLKPVIRPLPGLKQCESVCYSADGTQIFVSSEGKGAPVYVFQSSF